ncbi:MAG TPA: hypothetical protein VFX48_06535, partial [Saprospiraceae bacterium]|nr:hypothetical protein [Saprospiraceae bacterium]
MHIVVVSATKLEIQPLLDHLTMHWTHSSSNVFSTHQIRLTLLVTGIGSAMMSFALGSSVDVQKADLVLHLGVSGSYHPTLRAGQLVE